MHASSRQVSQTITDLLIHPDNENIKIIRDVNFGEKINSKMVM